MERNAGRYPGSPSSRSMKLRSFAVFQRVCIRSTASSGARGHLVIAFNSLLFTTIFHALQQAGFEKRGDIIRQVQTLRGGDRAKGAEQDFADVSVMSRSCWKSWSIFRKPFQGTVADNLRRWGTAGLHRNEPFKDIVPCSPTHGQERRIAPHPSLKPQRFLRRVVRASLPLGIGIVYDPFAGSGSTLAAAEAVGYRSVGTDHDLWPLPSWTRYRAKPGGAYGRRGDQVRLRSRAVGNCYTAQV